jgi:hypothetical protein
MQTEDLSKQTAAAAPQPQTEHDHDEAAPV